MNVYLVYREYSSGDGGCYDVVLTVCATQENADEFVERYERENPRAILSVEERVLWGYTK